jgi:hypothetical protein
MRLDEIGMNFKLASVGIFLLMVLAIGLVLKKSGREGDGMRNLRSRYHPVSVEGFACRVQGVGVEFEAMDIRDVTFVVLRRVQRSGWRETQNHA